MKKSFPLNAAGKDDARVRDKIRHELNKYAKRERKKDVPAGYFRWDLNCRVGADEESAAAMPFKDIANAIDTVAATGPAIAIDAAAVALGFGVMTLSQVPANARLGGLLVLSIAGCLPASA